MRTIGIAVTDGALRAADVERRGSEIGVAFGTPEGLPGRGRPDSIVAGLPAHAITHRVLELPFRDGPRLAAVCPLELYGQLPFEPADGVVGHVVLERHGEATTVLAAVVHRPTLTALTERIIATGLPRPAFVVDVLAVLGLVPTSHPDVAVVLVDTRISVALRCSGRLAGLRAIGAHAEDVGALAAELRWSFAALGAIPPLVVLGGPAVSESLRAELAARLGCDVRTLDELTPHTAAGSRLTAVAVEYALATLAPSLPGMLVLGERPPLAARARRRLWRLATAAALLAMLDLALYRQGLVRRDAALTRVIAAQAADALRGERIVAPRAQLESALAAASRARVPLRDVGGPLEVLRMLSEQVPSSMRLGLDELEITGDAVRLHGRADSFDAVDSLRAALAGAPILTDVATDDTRTTVDGRGVEFRLHARLRSTEGTSS